MNSGGGGGGGSDNSGWQRTGTVVEIKTATDVVDFNNVAITASGNPSWNTGFGNFTVDGLSYFNQLASFTDIQISGPDLPSIGYFRVPIDFSQSIYTSGGDGYIIQCAADGAFYDLNLGSSTRTAYTSLNAAVGISVVLGGVAVMFLQGPSITIYSPSLTWAAATANPTISQSDLTSSPGAGQTMLIHAQDETGIGGIGGRLNLRAGHGATHGVLALQDANGADRVLVDASNDVTLNGANYTYLAVGGLSSYKLIASAAEIDFYVSYLEFGSAVVTPTIGQWDLLTADGTGQAMLIHAQDATGGGNSTGGSLSLRPGMGFNNGALYLQDGYGIDQLSISTDLAQFDADVLLNSSIRASGLPENFTYVGVAGTQSTNNAGWTGIGAIVFDPTLSCSGNAYISKTIYFRAVLETTAAPAECDIRLYNLDDAEAVTNTTLTSTSTTPERKLSAGLTMGVAAGDIKTSVRTYEVQIFRSGGLITDYVTCKLAQLELRFA